MFNIWRSNIESSSNIIRRNQGTKLLTVVSGSRSDQSYWQQRLTDTRRDVFRADKATTVISTLEETRKGNFLGTFDAWIKTLSALGRLAEQLPEVALVSMVVGQGKRLSPFTQALGNRKPAFPTPRKSSDQQTYLTTADLANRSAALLTKHLASGGFRGLIVKWGDEAIIPGIIWKTLPNQYKNVDAIRFVWKTELSDHLAREKDWVVFDSQNGLKFQYPRQEVGSLRQKLSAWSGPAYSAGVNLGSLAISYPFLEVACKVLGTDIASADRWLDWDPYVWMALCCQNKEQWQAEIDDEERTGRKGIRSIQSRYPDFYDKIQSVRARLEERLSRPMSIAVLDFGRPFWMDWGLHISLRKTLESLTTDSDEGMATRELFRIPHERDQQHNIILHSSVPAAADIRNSVIVDTVITDPKTVIRGGVVVGGRHRLLDMPYGGSALFCVAHAASFTGPQGVAFRSVATSMQVPEGGRHTTVFLSDGPHPMVSNEAIVDYEGDNYSKPILENTLSFEEAASLVSKQDVQALERQWTKYQEQMAGGI